MNLKTLSSEGKIACLIKPILKVLQEAGGQLERSEIKERIADMDDQIAEYSVLEKKSKQTGNTYCGSIFTKGELIESNQDIINANIEEIKQEAIKELEKKLKKMFK